MSVLVGRTVILAASHRKVVSSHLLELAKQRPVLAASFPKVEVSRSTSLIKKSPLKTSYISQSSYNSHIMQELGNLEIWLKICGTRFNSDLAKNPRTL